MPQANSIAVIWSLGPDPAMSAFLELRRKSAPTLRTSRTSNGNSSRNCLEPVPPPSRRAARHELGALFSRVVGGGCAVKPAALVRDAIKTTVGLALLRLRTKRFERTLLKIVIDLAAGAVSQVRQPVDERVD